MVVNGSMLYSSSNLNIQLPREFFLPSYVQSKDGEKAGSDIGLHTETSPVHEASFGSRQDRPSPDRERPPGPSFLAPRHQLQREV